MKKELNRILIFTKEYHHPKISVTGGTGVFYKNLAHALTERGFQVTIFGSNRTAVDFSENGIRFKFVQEYFKKYPLKEFLRSFSGKVKLLENFHFKIYTSEKRYLEKKLLDFIHSEKVKPQIIETHDWEGISQALLKCGIPYIVRFHGSWKVLGQYFGYGFAKGKVYCEDQALPISENNIVISQYSEKINKELFNIPTPRLIYNGTNCNLWIRDHSVKEIPYSIFFYGEVKEKKGAYVALGAFLKLQKSYPDCTLHFIGYAGKNEDILKRMAGSENQKNIFFYGRKNHEEARRLLSAATIVFFPSKGENFSLSLLEVMSLGKPVICSAIPSFQEIISEGQTGMIAQNADVFATKASLLFENKVMRDKISAEARTLITDHFSINKMVDKTIAYYKEIYERHQQTIYY